MEITLHKSEALEGNTKIESNDRIAVVFPEKGDSVKVWAGINRIEIKYSTEDGCWIISHNSNTKCKLVPIVESVSMNTVQQAKVDWQQNMPTEEEKSMPPLEMISSYIRSGRVMTLSALEAMAEKLKT